MFFYCFLIQGIFCLSYDHYVNKTTPDSFYRTDLDRLLKEKQVTKLLVSGLQTEYCVDTSCRSAFGRKYKTILVTDAHSTYDNEFMKADQIVDYHQKIIGQWFAKLHFTEEILSE